MNRTILIAFAAVLILCFSACGKNNGSGNNNAPDSTKIKQTLIAGKWTMQKQTYVKYVNGIMQTDTTCIASDSLANYVQFNADSGTFKSGSIQTFGVGSLSLSATVESITVGGLYSFTSTAFNLTPTVAGIYLKNGVTLISGVASLPIYALVSHTVKLDQISTTHLSFFAEDVYQETINSVTATYKVDQVFYYTK